MCTKRPRAAFTLVELLVVIAIIGILVSLLLPAVQSARESGRRVQCANHFKQVGIALKAYEASKRTFPPGMIGWDSRWAESCGPKPSQYYIGWGWGAFVLPYVEQQSLYDRIDWVQLGYAAAGENRKISGTLLPFYVCPSDPQDGELVGCCSSWTNGGHPYEDVRQTNICGVADSTDWTCNGIAAKQWQLNDGMFGERQGCRAAQVRDGLSNTLMVGEVTGGGPKSYRSHFWAQWAILDTRDGINGPFTVPGNQWAADEYHRGTYTGFRDTGFSSFHPGGCFFACGDGSVHFLSETTDTATLAALTTRDGGDIVAGDAF